MITFGPVTSRRLGKSLGINNIISPKACPYDCVYCQVGKTIRKSCKRELIYEPEVICQNVGRHLKKINPDNYPDYLTFVSNGEPTLDINLGRSLTLLKKFGIPLAVITNASLLSDKSLREDLYQADWISVKMDAGDNETWKRVNRPAVSLNFAGLIENIILFAGEYKGKLCTETMLVDGLNDVPENFTKLAEFISEIKPYKAYLAIPTRPPSMTSIKPPDPEKLDQAWQVFHDMHINTELLTGFEGADTGYTGNIYDDILNITAVHPLREDALFNLLQKDKAVMNSVTSLINQQLIKQVNYNGSKYYLRYYHFKI